ncbi:MAG TPA: hypothetical protein VGD78_15765 [Chthoniobacterales bacterium]
MTKTYQNGKASLSMVVTSLVITLLFAGLVGLIAWQRQGIPNENTDVREKRLKNLADLVADNDKVLTQYRWIDRTKGVVGIPVERAKQLVLADLEGNKPHPAGPVNPAPPAPNSNGAPAPTTNPAASPSPAAGVQPAAPAPGPNAPPAPVVNPQSVPAPSPAPAAPSPTPA